jgi:hypothetical protein
MHFLTLSPGPVNCDDVPAIAFDAPLRAGVGMTRQMLEKAQPLGHSAQKKLAKCQGRHHL